LPSFLSRHCHAQVNGSRFVSDCSKFGLLRLRHLEFFLRGLQPRSRLTVRAGWPKVRFASEPKYRLAPRDQACKMSILSRLLKREGEGENPAAASVQAEPPVPTGPLPVTEYPESAESTDQSLALRADDPADSGVVQVDVQRTPASPPAPPPLPPQARPAAAAVSPEQALAAQAAPLRDLIQEVRWGTAQPRWLPLVRPVVQGLRDQMASEAAPAPAAPEVPPVAAVDAAPAPAPASAPEASTEAAVPPEAAAPVAAAPPPAASLPTLLDALAAALDLAAAGPGGASALSTEARKAVLAAYEPLVQRRPALFALEGDADGTGDGAAAASRREQLIVESLLGQVPGLDPLSIGKLTAVGLGRLENLVAATVEEISGVAGLPEPIAAALVDRVVEYRRSSPPALLGESRAVRRSLEPLLNRLDTLHTSFERAASGWTEQDAAAKRRVRREREQAYMAMRAALARQGAVEFLVEIEKLPFGRRIEALGRFLKEPRVNPGSGGGMDDGRAHA
jgi:hypothetical protein